SVGYNRQEVKLGNRSRINVQLQSLAQQMSEVVMVGYGTVRRSDLTGSVSSVSVEKITQVKGVSTVAQVLQGQAAGVQVFQRSGQPGEAVSIKVRGTNSIQASNDVLYVVEGGVF
ncbi:MAG: TonB-dependent receptor, partial [Flavisolibacter sp.]|nr:TonB-dependent receptor [Flavisolibacter sp.]